MFEEPSSLFFDTLVLLIIFLPFFALIIGSEVIAIFFRACSKA